MLPEILLTRHAGAPCWLGCRSVCMMSDLPCCCCPRWKWRPRPEPQTATVLISPLFTRMRQQPSNSTDPSMHRCFLHYSCLGMPTHIVGYVAAQCAQCQTCPVVAAQDGDGASILNPRQQRCPSWHLPFSHSSNMHATAPIAACSTQ